MSETKRYYDFSAEKNQQLIEQRGISFEEAIAAIGAGNVLDILPHPNKTKYPNQEMYIVDINGYVYVIPFVAQGTDQVFLKTIFPQRKLTKQYLRGKQP